MLDHVLIRQWGLVSYRTVYTEMQRFTQLRTKRTLDEIWLVQHFPVITLGKAANRAHILEAESIPIVETDRGGDVTYHGPGQAVIYLLFDLHRRFQQFWVHRFVYQLESAVIQVLNHYQILGIRRPGAPGVYIPNHHGAKIAALGLKVNRKGYTYHGIALNVNMDLSPFQQIYPCGFQDLLVTDMKTEGVLCQTERIQFELVQSLASGMDFVT